MFKLFLTFFIFIESMVGSQLKQDNHKPTSSNIIFKSTDGGQTWQDISDGLSENEPARFVLPYKDQVFLAFETGIYRSQINEPTPIWNKDFLLDEKISEIFRGADGPYIRSYENGFYKELSKTGIWLPVFSVLNGNRVRSILEASDGALYISSDNGIFKSRDRGQNWKQVVQGQQVLSLVELNGVIIGGGFQGLIRSIDNGNHWNWVLTNQGSIRKTGIINGHFYAITNGNGPWDEIMKDQDGLANSFIISYDNGKTWTNLDDGLTAGRYVYDPNQRQIVQFLNDIEQQDGYLFCSLNSGIYRSCNQGKTWELVFADTSKLMFTFAVSGKVIYAIRSSLLGGC